MKVTKRMVALLMGLSLTSILAAQDKPSDEVFNPSYLRIKPTAKGKLAIHDDVIHNQVFLSELETFVKDRHKLKDRHKQWEFTPSGEWEIGGNSWKIRVSPVKTRDKQVSVQFRFRLM